MGVERRRTGWSQEQFAKAVEGDTGLKLVADGEVLRIVHDDLSAQGESRADRALAPELPSAVLDQAASENRERINALRQARCGVTDLSDILLPVTWKTVAAVCVALLLFVAAALSSTTVGLVAVGVALILLSAVIAIDHFKTRRRRT